MRKLTNDLFAGYKLDWGDEEGFYTNYGDFTVYMGELVPDSVYVPMTFEYGTMDSQTTMGSLLSVRNMILENQGFHYGYKTERDEKEVKGNFMEMYYPTAESWRTSVMDSSRDLLGVSLRRFLDLTF